jgi:voltage-gated potassium channel
MAVYYVETGLNPNILHWGDALYYSVTVMTSVGLGDITPKTGAGKIISALMMLSGTAIYVAFTASLATVLLESEKAES